MGVIMASQILTRDETRNPARVDEVKRALLRILGRHDVEGVSFSQETMLNGHVRLQCKGWTREDSRTMA